MNGLLYLNMLVVMIKIDDEGRGMRKGTSAREKNRMEKREFGL
jgi:hypothetical protein